MNRETLVLAAMAPAEGGKYSPVQIQKLIFLLDRRIPETLQPSLFNFQPYHYGPFDKDVYHVLESLTKEGYVHITHHSGGFRDYSLTPSGLKKGNKVLNKQTPRVREFIRKTSEFVRECSFSELVSVIYKAFPEMRANSVFES